MTSQTNEITQRGRTTKSTGTFFREKINLAADGYVYHPRFQIFLTRLTGMLNEASVSGSADDFPRLTSASAEYEFRTIFLPEHPYNLELYKLHREASAPGTFLRGQTGEIDAQGAMFSYEKKPYYFHTGYSEQSVDSARNQTNSRHYRTNGGYHGRMFSHSAAYSHGESGSARGVHNEREAYSYGNGIHIAGISLDSRVNESIADHLVPLEPDFHTRSFAWTEQLTFPLPLNFDTTSTFGYTDEISRSENDPSGAESREDFNRSHNTSVSVSHHLYKSVVTRYTTNRSFTKSNFGEIKTKSDSLGSTYSKLIPSGRFIAGVHFAESEAERRGTPAIINETHGAALFGSFTLNLQNIIEDSIRIQILDPATESLVSLAQSGYLISRLGSGIRITITSVSPVETQTDPAYTYEFHVAYSLLDESKIASASSGYSLKLDLLDNLLSPYYSYSTTHQEVLSGTLAGGPERSTSETAGITTQVGNYLGLIEHRRFSSRLSPSETWTTSAQYQTPISETSNLTTLLSHIKTDYFPSEALPESEAFRERIIGATVSVSSNFPKKKMSCFLAGSYSRSESIIDSDSLSLNSNITWRVGLLNASAGAQLTQTESMLPTGRIGLFSQYYFLTLTRKLF